MNCKIVRTREGFEALVVYEPVEFDSPDKLSFGTNRILMNPSANESICPIEKGVAYGWLLAPNCRKVPLIVTEFFDVPAATMSIGFSKNTGSCADFKVSSVDELSQILEERYLGTTNALLVTDKSNANYVGQFYDRVVKKLLAASYTSGKSVKPFAALMLTADDVRVGFSIVKQTWPNVIDQASDPTVSAVILKTNNPSNIYISEDTLKAVHDKLSTEVDAFSNEKKNIIFNAMRCFNPAGNSIIYAQLDGQDANGYFA